MIACLPYGAVFAVADFENLASPKTVSKMLNRLCEEGTVRRVLRSVFWKPDAANSSPEPDEVAKALARENRWDMAPSGETALHLFGLRESEPSVWTYVTTGSCREYIFDGKKLHFAHTSGQFIREMSQKTKLFIQCIRAYGEEHLSEEVLKGLVHKLTDIEWKNVISETKEAAAWVKKVLYKMIDFKGLSGRVER